MLYEEFLYCKDWEWCVQALLQPCQWPLAPQAWQKWTGWKTLLIFYRKQKEETAYPSYIRVNLNGLNNKWKREKLQKLGRRGSREGSEGEKENQCAGVMKWCGSDLALSSQQCNVHHRYGLGVKCSRNMRGIEELYRKQTCVLCQYGMERTMAMCLRIQVKSVMEDGTDCNVTGWPKCGTV